MTQVTLVEKEQKILVIVWTAFLAATGFYLWLPSLLPARAELLGELTVSPLMRAALWILVVIEMGFLVWWKKHFLTEDAILGRIRKVSLVWSFLRRTGAIAGEGSAKALSCYLVGKIGGFTIAESFAIYGFVLRYNGRYVWDQYALSGICIALLLYLYPSKIFLVELMNKVSMIRDEI